MIDTRRTIKVNAIRTASILKMSCSFSVSKKFGLKGYDLTTESMT